MDPLVQEKSLKHLLKVKSKSIKVKYNFLMDLLKEIGEHNIVVSVHPEVNVEVLVKVSPE